MLKISETLNGAVQGQGVKVDVRHWLDMGSKEWKECPDEVKAAAYQAALLSGWTEQGLIRVMLSEFKPRVDEEWAKTTIATLKEMLESYPVVVEGEVKGTDILRARKS